MTPEKIDRYEIEDLLGQGAMGVVYKAYDPVLERYAAIKVMHAAGEVDDEMRDRFFQEARSAAKLNHPNIISVYDLGTDQKQPFIAMEYLEGEDLKETLQKGTFLPFEQRLRFVIEVCEGLEYAHRQGIVHRDIKPGNIFITRDGILKILDFGLARLGSAPTSERGIMGTPYYMSPEQVRGEADIDGRSDLFSAGVLLYELLSYQRPFEGETPTSICFQIVSQPHPSLSEIVPGCPEELEQIIDRALCKDPAERYGSGSALAADLENILKRLPRAQATLKKEIESLQEEFTRLCEQFDDPEIRKLVESRQGDAEKSKAERPDYANQLSWHAVLYKGTQTLRSRSEEERRLQLSSALSVARAALEQHDFDRSQAAISLVLETVPEHEEAKELKRRVRLKKKLLSKTGKQSAGDTSSNSLQPEQAKQVKNQGTGAVAELFEFACQEAQRGSHRSALRNLSFLLELEPDHADAQQLRQETEAALRRKQTGAIVRKAAKLEAGADMGSTQPIEEMSQPVDAQPAPRPRTPARPSPVVGRPRFGWLAGVLPLMVLAVAAIYWWTDFSTQSDTASLILNVAPWAQVESVTPVGSTEPLTLDPDLITPCVLSLPPGQYRVRVHNPDFGEPLEFEVTLAAGQGTVVNKQLPAFNLDEELSTILQSPAD